LWKLHVQATRDRLAVFAVIDVPELRAIATTGREKQEYSGG
jgi:hypothetical protein